MSKQSTKAFATLLLFCVVILAKNAFAQVSAPVVPTHKTAPEWQEEQAIDVTAFRLKIDILPLDITIPTIVEIPVSGNSIEAKKAIALNESGVFESAYYKENRTYPTIPVKITAIESNKAMAIRDVTGTLADDYSKTVENFSYTEGDVNTVTFTISSKTAEHLTSSVVRMSLAPNVALPRYVTVAAEVVGDAGGTARAILVARKALTSTEIRFPETTAHAFTITLEYEQPLRLTELTLEQKNDVISSDTIRFLAQPNLRYTLFINPDRPYGSLQSGGVSLINDNNVFRLVTGSLQNNPQYQPADTDKDGIPDGIDNCKNVPNPDQKDSDLATREGDACDDFDRDGAMTIDDNCPNDPNSDQRDTDGDGIGDVCDTEEDRLTERAPWIPWFGMGIAGAVLIGLLVMSVGMKPTVVPQPETQAVPKPSKEEEEKSNELPSSE